VTDDTPIPADSGTRLALVEVDDSGRVVDEWDTAALADSAGSIRLRAPADVDVAASGRLVLESGDPEVRVRLTRVERRTAPRDDVLLIIVDTLRADALSCYGAPIGRSTVVDSLAMNGILFRNAVAQSPITGPSHASIFTSRSPLAAGIVNNHEGELTWDVPTLAELLRWNGYDCRGAISISPIVRRHGFARGFHAWDQALEVAYLRRGSRTIEATRAFSADDDPVDPRPRFTFVHLSEPHEPYDAYGTVDERARIVVDGNVVADLSLSDFDPGIVELDLGAGRHALRVETTTRALARRFEIRDRNGTGAYLDDEVPLDLPAGTWSSSLVLERPGTVELIHVLNDHGLDVAEIQRRYALEAERTDRLVGDVLRLLRASGRADRTWVVFTADHGESLGEHNHIGHVKNLFEPSVRVPLIVCPPVGRDGPRGVVRDDLAAGVDVLPTILDLVGIDVPDAAGGHSLRHHSPRDRTVLEQTNTPQAPSTRYAHRGVDWKLVWNVDRETTRYFDLARDPGEREDVAPRHPELVDRRRKALEERVFELLSTNRRAEASIDPETEAALRALGYMN
jgi:choline-sulfatase